MSLGKKSSLHPVLWPVLCLSHCLWHHSGLWESKEPLVMGVRTMPLLSDILWMRPTQKEPRGCHQTLTCLLSSSASSPCRGHPQSCQSQSPTHEVARRACRTIWKPYFPFSYHNHWNFREKACGGWRVGVGNSSLQTSRSIGSPSLSAGYDTIEIQSP